MITNEANFVIYPNLFWSGYVEVTQQESDIFNAASNGCINLVTEKVRGDYQKQSFIKATPGLISSRNPLGTGAVQPISINMGEIADIKVNKRIGPVAVTYDALEKQGYLDPYSFSIAYGQQWGKAMAADYANLALNAVRAAIASQPTLQYNNTVNQIPSLTQTALVNGMQVFGDRASRIKAFVMPSLAYFELVKQGISDKVTDVASVILYGGVPASLGKPVLVVDSPALFTGSTGSNVGTYDVLCLTEGAVTVTESEDRRIISLPNVGSENLGFTVQGEYALNLAVKGVSWNLAGAGVSPNDATVSNPTSWTPIYADIRESAGSRVTCV